MHKFLLSLLLLLTVSAKAQTTDSLVGKWKYKDAIGAGLDSTERAALRTVFKDLEIDLRSDKTYSAFFFKKENGTWVYDGATKTLTLTGPKKEDHIRVLNITDKELTLEMDQAGSFILEKAGQQYLQIDK